MSLSLILLSVCSTHGHEVDANDFIFGTYRHMYHPCIHIKYFECTYMSNAVDIFVSVTYMTKWCEVDVPVGFVLTPMCTNVGSNWPHRKRAM